MFATATTTYPGTHVLEPSEVFDYSSFIMSTFPQQYKAEPMVGFKILLKDVNPTMLPGDKIALIDQLAPQIFMGKFCMLREGPITDTSLYYLISLPVPLSMLNQQIQNISTVYYMLYQYKFIIQLPTGQRGTLQFGLGRQPRTEICVSGRANPFYINRSLSSLNFHPRYKEKLVQENSVMSVATEYLSNEYSCLRFKFDIPDPTVLDDMTELAQVISSVFASAS